MKGRYDSAFAVPVTAQTLDDAPGKLVQTGDTLLWGYHIANTVAAITYVQLFNAAALVDVTLGTTVPDAVLVLDTSAVGAESFPVPFGLARGFVAFSTTTATGDTAAISHATFMVG